MTGIAQCQSLYLVQGATFEAQLSLDLGVAATVISSDIDCFDAVLNTLKLSFSTTGGTIAVSYAGTKMIFLLSASDTTTRAITSDELHFDWRVVVSVASVTKVLYPLRGTLIVEKTYSL